MDLERYRESINLNRKLAEQIGFNPYYFKIESGLDDPVLIEGQPFINLASNNYLGLAGDGRVKSAMIAAIDKYGASLCGTPIATGNIDLFQLTETKLADFVGLEAAILLPSCYQANNGLFGAIAGKEDLIIVDHYAHSSLIQGIKAAGCKIRPFLHNNLEHLQKILKQTSGFRQVFIVTESVFSTEGSIAPFREIVDLAGQFGAVPVIDDSHGIGVLGQSGRGILEEAGLTDFQGIYTASLGKALAGLGGMIAGNATIIEYLKYNCPHLIYSTALPPASLAGILKVLEIITTDFAELRTKLILYKHQMEQALKAAGLECRESKAPITSIIAGNTAETLSLSRKFYHNGILTTPFVAPSVPVGEGRVRLIAGANLKPETVQKAVSLIAKIGKTGG
jgi:7-keto-8-aminopelargonate synthetase-like enzyme